MPPKSACFKQAGLQDDDHLTAVVQHAKLAATGKAFALWCFGGDKVVTWGSPQGGGDKSSIQQGMREVLSSQRGPNPQAMLYWEVLQQSTLIHLLVELLQNSRHETAENDIGERITGPRAQMGRGLIFLGRELEERVGMQCPDSSDKVHRQSSFQ